MQTVDENLIFFRSLLEEYFGLKLKKFVLFGSRARGEATAESDYDCLLIFERFSPDDRIQLDAAVARLLLERGAVFSAFPLEETRLDELRFEPFLMNAQREGISL